ncbi:ionotropic receptor 75a-like [Zerene cesonia]|uniref:ionotropic receptor 75a-like n=1 Tax=Zerene cesonia TaxID=33412 RepID=UPI0018E55DBC|nr:ionotropic receptor 75a-like [Zerene cesonia]
MKFLLIFIYCASNYFGNTLGLVKDKEVKLISDLQEHTNRSSLIFITCWSEDAKVKVYKNFGKEKNKPITIQFANYGDVIGINDEKENILLIADLHCENISTSLKMYEERKLFRSPLQWILITNEEKNNSGSIFDFYNNIDILLDVEVMVVQKLQEKYVIEYVYKISNQSRWRSEFFGEWSTSHSLQKRKDWIEVAAIRRRMLDGHVISVCYVLTDADSINHLTDGVNDHIDTITKVNFPTTNHLLDFLNASRKYVFTDTWGYRINNTWNGMTGYLNRAEVEIGGSPMFFTSQRISVVEYISSPTPTRSKFVFRQPKLSYENNLFVLSFQKYLWYGSGALIVLLFLFLFIATIWEWKMFGKHASRAGNSSVLQPNVFDVTFLVFAATCQQGTHVELKGSLGRIVLLQLFVAVTFLYTSYSANIVALLQSSSSQIRTLDDLLHSRLAFGVHDTVFNRYYFSVETEPVRKAIYQTKIAPVGIKPRFMNMEEGIKKMRNGLFAFHMETGVGYKFVGKYFQEGEKCGLKEIQYLQVIDPWLAVRKDTQFMEILKIGTKRLQEHGLQQRENRMLYEKRPKCLGRQENFVSVSMVDCYPAILILSYGCLLSGILLTLEILNNSKNMLKNSCANNINLFRYPTRWLIVGKTEELKNYNINIDSEIIVAEEERFGFNLYMPYKISKSRNIIVNEHFGSWSTENGLNKAQTMIFSTSMRRKNLMGIPITISSVISEENTKNEIMSLRNIFVDTVAKTSYRQIIPLFDFMNATMVIIYTDTWGYIINGSYNGMVGDMVRGNADLAGTIIFITKSRLDVLEYLVYPSPPTTKFVFRQPSLSYQNNLFILPFKPVVWMCIFGLILLLTIILFINAYWERMKLDNFFIFQRDQTVLRPSLSDIVIMVISAISQQGSSNELKGTLGRVVMFILFFAFVFLYTSYSANIVALLQSNSNQIRTLSDLLNSRLELGAEDTQYNRYHFSTATEPIKKSIYQTKIAPQGSKANFMSLEEGVKNIQTKPFAFNMNLGTGYKIVERYFHEHEKCGLQEIQYIQESKAWQTCRKNSPYKEIYKIGLMRNQEHGLNDRENRLVYAKKPMCAFRGSSFDSVNMIDFYPALLLLAYGTILSVLSLFFEVVYWLRARRNHLGS